MRAQVRNMAGNFAACESSVVICDCLNHEFFSYFSLDKASGRSISFNYLKCVSYPLKRQMPELWGAAL